MAMTTAAINAVASQPKNFNTPRTTNGPIMSRRAESSIITTIIGTATTPLITALQNSALIGSIGVKLMTTPTQRGDRQGGVESLRLLRAAGQADGHAAPRQPHRRPSPPAPAPPAARCR